MFTCPDCSKSTEGSIGPASGCRTPLCPECRSRTDGEIETLVRQSVEMQTVFDNLFPSVVQELETIA